MLLTDLRMPGCDDVEATRRVRTGHPGTAVVVLTTYADDASVLDALRAGAAGWLFKDADAEAIGRALRSAAGLSNGEIARRLVVSEATVKTHVNRVFAKAGLRDRAQAVGYAYRHGLVPG